jgi:hypothetical protein
MGAALKSNVKYLRNWVKNKNKNHHEYLRNYGVKNKN